MDLNKKFLERVEGQSFELNIYSIVNSLAAVSSVNKVQIAVNGSQDVMFRDVVSLNTTFERSQNYIDGESQ